MGRTDQVGVCGGGALFSQTNSDKNKQIRNWTALHMHDVMHMKPLKFGHKYTNKLEFKI